MKSIFFIVIFSSLHLAAADQQEHKGHLLMCSSQQDLLAKVEWMSDGDTQQFIRDLRDKKWRVAIIQDNGALQYLNTNAVVGLLENTNL